MSQRLSTTLPAQPPHFPLLLLFNNLFCLAFGAGLTKQTCREGISSFKAVYRRKAGRPRKSVELKEPPNIMIDTNSYNVLKLEIRLEEVLMKIMNYKFVFYSTVFIFVALFFFLNNDWEHRVALLLLATVLFGIIRFAPRKLVGISVIIVFIVFRIIDMLLISQ
ncbi:hypothetical protein D3H35_09305 [Cohnella faecalis]|uniref:Uncharacterized protein n=1 Tax=Cohnella faecalis TaxID=2315694 RepID=A0A398CXN1_9BACL|nr:hypothetical protein D3H35_09305 [Cohnella faecalis]